MADSSGDEWTEVNTKQKKKEKSAKKKAERQQREAERKKLKEKEREERQKEMERKDRPSAGGSTLSVPPELTEATMFTAFEEMEKRERRKKETIAKIQAEARQKKKQPNRPAASIPPPPSFEEAVKLAEAALPMHLEQLSSNYRDNWDVQLKCLADFFEAQFGALPLELPLGDKGESDLQTFQSKITLPLSRLGESKLPAVVLSWVDKIPSSEVVSFAWFLLRQLVGVIEAKKTAIPTSGLGLQLLLQMVFQHQPDTLLSHAAVIKQKYIGHPAKYRPRTFVLVVWGLSQVQPAAPHQALAAWYQLLLPLLNHPAVDDAVQASVMNYIELLLRDKRLRGTRVDDAIMVPGFESLMIICASEKPANPAIYNRLVQVYPQLRNLAVFFDPKSTPRKFFPMLLSHAVSVQRKLRDEVLGIIALCLARDPTGCLSVWRESYVRHIPHTNNIILYLLVNWDRLGPKLPAKELVGLVRHIVAVNKQLLEGNHEDDDGAVAVDRNHVSMCTITSKAFLKKLTKWGAGWVAALVLVVLPLVVAAALAYSSCLGHEACELSWCNRLLLCSPSPPQSPQ